jgi:DNA-binding winged helix-turn-helix (wHTH) protein/tetratricopeptide (TPR) repeat protein
VKAVSESLDPLFDIDDLRVDVARQMVSRDGEPLAVPELSFRLLMRLAQSAPTPVAVDELIRDVWQGQVVSPDTVKQRVKLLREALGDSRSPYRYIRTVRHGGYGLAQPVRSAASLRRFLVPSLLLIGFLAIATSVGWWLRPTLPRDGSTRVLLVPAQTTPQSETQARVAEELLRGLADELASIEGINMIAPGHSNRGAGEQAGPLSADFAADLSADAMIELAIEGPMGSPRLGLRLIDPDSGVQIFSRHYDLPETLDPDAQGRIVRHAANRVHQMLTATLGNHPEHGGSTIAIARDYYRRGMAHFAGSAAGNRERAESQFEAALQADPDFSLARARLADLYADRALANGHLEWAQRSLSLSEQALARHPDLPEALFAKAKAQLAQGETEQAFRLFDQVLVDRPYLERNITGLRQRADD